MLKGALLGNGEELQGHIQWPARPMQRLMASGIAWHKPLAPLGHLLFWRKRTRLFSVAVTKRREAGVCGDLNWRNASQEVHQTWQRLRASGVGPFLLKITLQ